MPEGKDGKKRSSSIMKLAKKLSRGSFKRKGSDASVASSKAKSVVSVDTPAEGRVHGEGAAPRRAPLGRSPPRSPVEALGTESRGSSAHKETIVGGSRSGSSHSRGSSSHSQGSGNVAEAKSERSAPPSSSASSKHADSSSSKLGTRSTPGESPPEQQLPSAASRGGRSSLGRSPPQSPLVALHSLGSQSKALGKSPPRSPLSTPLKSVGSRTGTILGKSPQSPPSTSAASEDNPDELEEKRLPLGPSPPRSEPGDSPQAPVRPVTPPFDESFVASLRRPLGNIKHARRTSDGTVIIEEGRVGLRPEWHHVSGLCSCRLCLRAECNKLVLFASTHPEEAAAMVRRRQNRSRCDTPHRV